MLTMLNIVKEKIIFNKRLIIEEAEIADGAELYTRMRLNRPDACAVLVFNTETNKVILTKQFRYGVFSKSSTDILEIMAGVMDDGEGPLETANREAQEEIGYKLHPGNTTLICSCFASPGYSSERFHIFFAEVTSSDKTGEGGGLKKENENIKIVEMYPKEFLQLIKDARIVDAKTIIAGLWLLNRDLMKN